MNARAVVLLSFLAAAPRPDLARAAEAPRPITIGETLVVPSAVLGEERRVMVHLPVGYSRATRYPVLYLTDAEDQFLHAVGTTGFLARNARMPQVIVVAITNTDRTRDLTPTRLLERNGERRPDFARSGGADRFLDFVEKELVPLVEGRYSTAAYRVFMGHSLGGLLATHAFSSRPSLFQATIAVSPSLDWDSDVAVKGARAYLDGRKELSRSYYLALGDEPRLQRSFDEMKRVLGKAAKARGFQWSSAQYPDEDHGTVVLRALYHGLLHAYRDWPLPVDAATGLVTGGARGVEDHHAKLSARYGYRVVPPEGPVNEAGYRALRAGQGEEAIALFRLNAANHEASANVHDSLGEALAASGRLEEARAEYARAVDAARLSSDRALAVFVERLHAIEQRLQQERKR